MQDPMHRPCPHASVKLVAGLIKKKGNIDYLINPAFWPALMIEAV